MEEKDCLYKSGKIYQASTMSALLAGVYDGILGYDQIRQHGNYGIGTFDHLDGEMIGFNGHFYRLRSGCPAIPVTSDDQIAYCTLAYFQPQITKKADRAMNRQDFENLLKSIVPSENLFYAVCIEGTFKEVSTRTVSYQKEHIPMTEAVQTQQVVQFQNIRGTMVGFWTPIYAQGISVPGYHFHFIDETLQKGGHVFDYIVDSVNISVDQKTHMDLYTPDTELFLHAELSRSDLMNEIKMTEG